jgi:hypothetical protein
MAALYSHKFTSHVTSQSAQALVENEWNIGLRGLTAEQIQHGIDRTRTECDWPPSVSEFINLCLDIPSLSEFLAGNDEMQEVAMRVSGMSNYYFSGMSFKDVTRWKKDTYKVAVQALRARRLSQEFNAQPGIRPRKMLGAGDNF